MLSTTGSGPGNNQDNALSAQREAVRNFVKAEPVDEFTENEGSHQRRRPHFEEAIKSAKRHHATLVIPRFRPIHRSAVFVDRLRDEGIDFVALDIPEANPSTITSIAAAAAEHRRMVSERIKTSLQAAKASGRGLGNPEIACAQIKALQAASDLAQEKRQALRGEVVELCRKRRSLRAIADELNRGKIPTARGRRWHASSVRKILGEAGGPTA